jgi:hypothetical protein
MADQQFGHAAAECPKRVDVTTAADERTVWVHGCRGEETHVTTWPEPEHLCLGTLIERLEKEDPARVVMPGFAAPHSHRGDYSHVAFEIRPSATVGAMLADARSALGATYEGWKGGDYTMDKWTPVHIVQEEGRCGEPLGLLGLELMLRNGQADE